MFGTMTADAGAPGNGHGRLIRETADLTALSPGIYRRDSLRAGGKWIRTLDPGRQVSPETRCGNSPACASPLCAWRTRSVLHADVNMPWSRRSSRALGRAWLCTPGVS